MDRFQVRSNKDDSLLGEFATYELANSFCEELEGFNDEKAHIVDTFLED